MKKLTWSVSLISAWYALSIPCWLAGSINWSFSLSSSSSLFLSKPIVVIVGILGFILVILYLLSILFKTFLFIVTSLFYVAISGESSISIISSDVFALFAIFRVEEAIMNSFDVCSLY